MKLLISPSQESMQVGRKNLGFDPSSFATVLYYSNDILSKAFPDLGPYISLLITVVNVIMTFPPIFLIERMGRKTLMTMSSLGALVSLVLVGFGINAAIVSLSSVAIVVFVACVASFIVDGPSNAINLAVHLRSGWDPFRSSSFRTYPPLM